MLLMKTQNNKSCLSKSQQRLKTKCILIELLVFGNKTINYLSLEQLASHLEQLYL